MRHIGLSLLFFATATSAYADMQTIRFQTDRCEGTATFDNGKYEAQAIRNTAALLYAGFVVEYPYSGVPVAEIDATQLELRCKKSEDKMRGTAFVADRPVQDYVDALADAVLSYCQTTAAEKRALADPTVARLPTKSSKDVNERYKIAEIYFEKTFKPEFKDCHGGID